MRRFRLRAVAIALVSAVALAGCGQTSDPISGDLPDAEVQHLLERRAEAVLGGDRAAFLATLDHTDAAFVQRQRRWFNNLQRLPVETLEYRVLQSDWPDQLRDPGWGSDVRVPQVQLTLKLAGVDSGATRSTVGFAVAHRDGRAVVVADRTKAGQPFPGSQPQPWDLVAVFAHRAGEALLLTGPNTDDRADELSGLIDRANRAIFDWLPSSWDGRVVVYAFLSEGVIDNIGDVPGGKVEHLGALAYPQHADPQGGEVVGQRLVLLPNALQGEADFLDRITRHELVHAALADSDDRVPLWVAEGVAEWVAAASLPPDRRRIAAVAVTRAQADVNQLPASASFNGPDQAWNYALAWMAIDWIAAKHGEAAVWDLVAALHNDGRGTTDDQQDAVLQDVIGVDSRGLARHAGERIRQIYG